jgi:hypothetical protein
VSLSKQLLAEPVRSAVVADLVDVVQQEVGDKKGLSGTAVKAGYGAARKVMPDLTERGVKRMLPDVVRTLDPYWRDFQAAGGGDFGQYLAGRGPEAAEALLAVSDSKVQSTSREPLKKAYKPLRGKAGGHVQEALPRLGAVIQKHAG